MYIQLEKTLFGFMIMTSDGYTPLMIYTPIFTEILQLDGFII